MLEAFFLTVSEWIQGGVGIAALGCFMWGMVSVIFSPCHLASIPLIVAYVGGQAALLKPRQAAFYSMAFTLGLFIAIALIGIICAWLGRMLGDVGNGWQILVGLVLIWVALGMLGVEKFTLNGNLLHKFNLRGVLRRPGAGFGLRGPFRLLHLWVYRPHPGHCDGPGEGTDRGPVYSPLCHGTLSPHRGGGEFHRRGETHHGKQPLAGGRQLVPKGSGGPHRRSGPLFYDHPFYFNLNPWRGGLVCHAMKRIV